MKITNDRIEECAYEESPNVGGAINPRVIVMHYTATWDAASAIRTLKNAASENRVSAHIVVATDGVITQMVPFRTKAWHAGQSHLDLASGRVVGLNSHSIGIEIVNPGWMQRNENGEYFDAYGRNAMARLNGASPILAPWDRVRPGPLYWAPYPEAQLDAIEELTRSLLQTYPSIEAIVGHSDITTRKIDPGPAFPIGRYQRLLANRSSDDDDVVFVPVPAPPIVVAPGSNTQMEPAPQAPTAPQPQPPVSRSRTIWGAIVAFFVGLAAFARELFTDPANWWANMKRDFIAAYGFNPAWILFGIFVLAIAFIIYARLDDRAKRKR